MTIKELIAELEQYPGDTHVYSSVSQYVELRAVTKVAYSRATEAVVQFVFLVLDHE